MPMLIDWTPFDITGFEPRTEIDEEGEEDYPDCIAIDSTDVPFAHHPWAEAEEGQVFACQWANGTVQIGRREDDAAILWIPADQATALERLIAARKVWLYNTIGALQAELTTLGGWDG